MTAKKIRVLIVDDSAVFVNFLTKELPQANARIEIVGYAMSAAEAMRKIPDTKPDVITLDVEMPRMNGIDFLKELLPRHLIPVILVSSLNVSVFDALSNGAVDFVKKPDMSKNYTTRAFAQGLATKILIASNATVKLPRVFGGSSALKKDAPGSTKGFGTIGGMGGTGMGAGVIGGTGNAGMGAGSVGGMVNAATNATTIGNSFQKPVLSPLMPTKLHNNNSLKLNNLIIALGASTGGTEATLQVLERLRTFRAWSSPSTCQKASPKCTPSG